MVAELSARHALSKDVVDGCDGAHRRGAAVRRGSHAAPLGARRAWRRASHPADIATIAHGEARPARLRARNCADRRRDRPRLPLHAFEGVAGLDDGALEAALDRLADADILLVQGLLPDSDYRFKHALIQDAAYENLLKSRRQDLHARIAMEIETHFPEIGEQRPELLAHHATQAGLIERAVVQWGKAGRKSVSRSAMAEAVSQLRRGLELVPALPDTPERQRLELELQSALGGALVASRGIAAPETGSAYARARVLCEQLRRQRLSNPGAERSNQSSFWPRRICTGAEDSRGPPPPCAKPRRYRQRVGRQPLHGP